MIVVIGAGPAGLAAARQIAAHGDAVVVLDSNQRAGGQYWRHRSEVTGYKSDRSKKYLTSISESSLVTFIHGATVWSAQREAEGFCINYLQHGVERSLHASEIILATGAYDRSLPFPGWTVPGVMTPGAAQSLLKGHGVLAGKSVVICGTGPFLLPVASALAESGATVRVFEAHSPLRWLFSLPALILNPGKFPEFIYYIRSFIRLRIPLKYGYTVTAYRNGKAEISRITSSLAAKKIEEHIECDVVAAGWGFQPDVTLGGILGCRQKLDRDGTVIFDVDSNQLSSVPNIWIAGEATGIGGADLALVEGEIAGLAAMGEKPPLKALFTRWRKKVFARALQRSYPIGSGWQGWLEDQTLICRCEEVTSLNIRESVVELGASDARTSKLFTRAGMGLCQGRICSRNVSDVVCSTTGITVSDDERIAAHNRPIAAPISLGVLGDGISR